MIVVPVKEARLVVAMDDFEIRNELHLKQRCLIGMAPLIKLQIGSWKIQAMHICIVIFWTR
jgi:hypothetical protein